MLLNLSYYLKKAADRLANRDDSSVGHPYENIPFYQETIEPEEDTREIGMGPPSMYDEPDSSTRDKNKEDMRRQGPRPTPTDSLNLETENPVNDTAPIGMPRENLQGESWNDTTTPGGRGDDGDRDTVNYDEGGLTQKDEGGNVQF